MREQAEIPTLEPRPAVQPADGLTAERRAELERTALPFSHEGDWPAPAGGAYMWLPKPSIWQRIWPTGERRAMLEAQRTERFRREKMDEVWRDRFIRPIELMHRTLRSQNIELRLAMVLVDLTRKPGWAL